MISQWNREYFTRRSQNTGPAPDAVASFKQREKKQGFDGKSESDESQSTVHFKIDPIKNNREEDEDLWTNML